MNKNIETNTAHIIDEAECLQSRLKSEILKALKQEDIRNDISINLNYRSVTLFVPLEFSFQGENITNLRVYLTSGEAFKWHEEEVSGSETAQFTGCVTLQSKDIWFDLSLCAEDVVPLIEHYKERCCLRFRNLVAQINSLTKDLKPEYISEPSELNDRISELRDFRNQLEDWLY